jgi:hypothetical protein
VNPPPRHFCRNPRCHSKLEAPPTRLHVWRRVAGPDLPDINYRIPQIFAVQFAFMADHNSQGQEQ